MIYDPDARIVFDVDDPEEALRALMGIRRDPADLEPEEQVEDETED
jgi:hypothetical protein